jgi:hypothetical protein
MPESLDLSTDVAQMRYELEEVGEMVDALVRMNARDLKPQVLAEMKQDPSLAEVFLLVDGVTSQGEILKRLKNRGNKGASAASVSRKLEHLSKELHLIHFASRNKTGNVYRLTRLAEVLGIRRALGRST